MPSTRPIRTPIKVRLLRARERAAPVAVFLGAAALTAMLWVNQSASPQLVGRVEAVHYELRSTADGILVSMPGTQIERFSSVRKGQLLAQLDDAPLLAEHSTMLAELARLQSVLSAAEREALTDAAEFDLDALTLARRLAVDVENLRLDSVSLTARIQADESRLERAQVVYNAAQEAFTLGAQNQVALDELRLRRDEIAQRLEGQRAELVETRTQLASANDRYESLGAPAGAAQLDIILAPLRAELAVHESRLRELEIEAGALTLRAPIEGTISMVHTRPGQPVREGDPLLTLTSEVPSGIVAYLRQTETVSAIAVEQGGLVEIKSLNGRVSFRTNIDAIGPAVEPIPEHLLRDPRVPEWGRSMHITIPPESSLVPGELVSIRLVRGF